MTDSEVIRFCQWFYEENNLNSEWWEFCEQIESQHLHCRYLEEYIDNEICAKVQMISLGLIDKNSLDDYNVDIMNAQVLCSECEHCFD